MEAFDWSTQPPSAPSDHDADLLAAFLGTSFDDPLAHGNVSSDAYADIDLPPSASTRHDLGMLRCHDVGVTVPSGASSTGFHHLNPVGFLPVTAGSNTAFSGYSTTTGGGGGGNISSGESNTEVASSSSRPALVIPSPSSKRKLVLIGKHPSAATDHETAEERQWGAATTPTSTITFGRSSGGYEPDTEAIAQVKEMIYRAAAMRPVTLDAAGPSLSNSAAAHQKPRRRKNVRISSDPQTVAARLRREKVSERLRALQRLVPGGSKMDTATMLDEAASYLKFLKSQLAALETMFAGGGRSVQRYVDTGGRWKNQSQLSFGRDGFTGYVKPSGNMQPS